MKLVMFEDFSDIWIVFKLESVTLETKLKGEMVLNLFYTNLTISSVMILQVSEVRRRAIEHIAA